MAGSLEGLKNPAGAAAPQRAGPRFERPAAVDVIIPSWERADDTIAAVESALAQEGVDVTAIVVDQGSSEATCCKLRAAIAHRANVLLHELGYNAGVPGGRNIATQLGRGGTAPRSRRLASARTGDLQPSPTP